MLAKPGNTARPRPSIRSASGCFMRISRVGPSAAMRPSRTASAAPYRIDPASSAVTMVVSWISWVAAIPRYSPVARHGSQAGGRGAVVWFGPGRRNDYQAARLPE